MTPNWPTLEKTLFRLAADDIQTFAEGHSDETFYGFAFDCNSEYGQVLFCFNTPDEFQQRAKYYATKPRHLGLARSLDEQFGTNYEQQVSQKPRKTPEEYEDKLRWKLGDWKYQGFNSPRFESEWESFEDMVTEACLFRNAAKQNFMAAVCRVVIRLESDGVFHSLNRTDDFKVYAADHDEVAADSWERLLRQREGH